MGVETNQRISDWFQGVFLSLLCVWKSGVLFGPSKKERAKKAERCEKGQFRLIVTQVIEFFRGGPRGGDNLTSLFEVLQTLYSKRQKHPFSP